MPKFEGFEGEQKTPTKKSHAHHAPQVEENEFDHGRPPHPRASAGSAATASRAKQATLSQGAQKVNPDSTWKKHISSYSEAELLALRFATTDNFRKAASLTWKDPYLKNVPHKTYDDITLIIPKETVPHFRQHGLKFEIFTVSDVQTLPEHLSPISESISLTPELWEKAAPQILSGLQKMYKKEDS